MKFTYLVGIIPSIFFYDIYYTFFLFFGFGYGLRLKAEVLQGQNIRLRPKVKIVPMVQHCFLVNKNTEVSTKLNHHLISEPPRTWFYLDFTKKNAVVSSASQWCGDLACLKLTTAFLDIHINIHQCISVDDLILFRLYSC